MTERDPVANLKLRARIYCADEIAMGPGKADLLDAIALTGSISAAGRSLGMSYRRTWLLVDAMNRCWSEPLVATAHGGARGGGATLTPLGAKILADYRALQRAVHEAAKPHMAALRQSIAAEPRPARKPD